MGSTVSAAIAQNQRRAAVLLRAQASSSHCAPSGIAGRQMRQPARSSAATASAVSGYEYGSISRNCPIHAPLTPTSANTSGSTQHVDASSAEPPASVSGEAMFLAAACSGTDFTRGDLVDEGVGIIGILRARRGF